MTDTLTHLEELLAKAEEDGELEYKISAIYGLGVAALSSLPALIARVRELEDRGAQAVIAYHVAICSPKGVVPVDDLYDPAIAAKIEREMAIARRALANGDKA